MTDRYVTGGPELVQFLNAFPVRLRDGALKAGMVAGAAPVRDQARSLAPKKTGKMARAIRTGKPRVNQDGTVTVRIRLRKESSGQAYNDHAWLGVIWERGSRGYSGAVIRRAGRTRTRSKKLHAIKGGGQIQMGLNAFGRFPDIAPHAANPFMAPALDMRATDAVNAVGARIRAYLANKTSFTAPVTIQADGE